MFPCPSLSQRRHSEETPRENFFIAVREFVKGCCETRRASLASKSPVATCRHQLAHTPDTAPTALCGFCWAACTGRTGQVSVSKFLETIWHLLRLKLLRGFSLEHRDLASFFCLPGSVVDALLQVCGVLVLAQPEVVTVSLETAGERTYLFLSASSLAVYADLKLSK